MGNSKEQSPLKFETPLPGVRVLPSDSQRLRAAFLAAFRKTDPRKVPANIPTACVLNGIENKNYLTCPEFMGRKNILFYLDGVGEVRRTTPKEISDYLVTRRPWEDYDICLFDETMKWCVGITHNEQIIVVE